MQILLTTAFYNPIFVSKWVTYQSDIWTDEVKINMRIQTMKFIDTRQDNHNKKDNQILGVFFFVVLVFYSESVSDSK